MCWIDLCLFPLCFFLSFFLSFFHVTPTHPPTHTHTRAHTPGSCFIKNPPCYWLPKLPLNFHLALRLVYVPAPLVLSPKPLEALLAGRSMAHSPRRSGRGADCGCSVSHLFLPLQVFFIRIETKLSPRYSFLLTLTVFPRQLLLYHKICDATM